MGEPATTPRSSHPYGVNLAGYLTGESGLGEAARLGLKAIRCAGIPHVANNVVMAELENHEVVEGQFAEANPYKFNLIWVNVDQADYFAWWKGRSYFSDRYNIGFWAWETPELPPEWLPHFRYYDEIWVPSHFVQDIISRKSPIPVVRIPHPVIKRSEESAGSGYMKELLGLPPDSFVFTFIFHFHSSFDRKNPLAAIRAFKQAFPGNENVHLVIKSAAGAGTPGLEAIRSEATGCKVHIVDATMSRPELTALFEASDCYVSLHRSEGFGLTMAEAMTFGLPVIATNYGGNTDFMSPHNSYLVDHELVHLAKDTGAYRKGWRWAEPSVAHAAELMRHVYENREEARLVGDRGRQDVLERLSPQRVGGLMRERLLMVDQTH